jgi:hypothetical protein
MAYFYVWVSGAVDAAEGVNRGEDILLVLQELRLRVWADFPVARVFFTSDRSRQQLPVCGAQYYRRACASQGITAINAQRIHHG